MTTAAGVTLDDMLLWGRERFEEITPEGGLSLVGVVRYQANGVEVPLHSCSSKGPSDKWTPEHVMTTLEQIASRDARGLSGMSQYQVFACYGTSTKPSRFQPFQRFGALAAGPLPNGGLGLEGPHPTGIVATGTRWGELAVQQAGAQSAQLWQHVMSELRSLREFGLAWAAESRESTIALRTLAVASANADADRLLKLAIVRRQHLFGKEGLKLVPGLANSFAGGPVFGAETGDASLFRGMTKFFDDDTLRLMSAAAERKGPEAQAFVAAVATRAVQIRKQEEDEDAQLRELEREEFGQAADGSVQHPREVLEDAVARMDAAAADASGQPRRLAHGAGGNGHANGHAPPAPSEPASDATAAKAAVLGRMFDSMSDDDASFMFAAMRARGQGELAADLETVMAAHKGGK